MEQVFVNGVGVYPFSSVEELVEYANGRNKILIAINAEKITHATDQTRDIINDNIGYCDGVGAVMAMRKYNHKDAIKIPGCELWLKIIAQQYKSKTFYLVGGKTEVIEATISKLKTEFDGINIVGYRDGYIKTDDEKQALINDIVDKKPDFVYVAMGSPKQELLMKEMSQSHRAVYQGLGGSFDVYIGAVNRAPKWWCNNGLEWAYRFIKQPSRFSRQFVVVKFLWLLKTGRI